MLFVNSKNKENKHNYFMKKAVKEAFSGMRKNDGGPFGAVIVKNNKIIAIGHNEVLKTNDPIMHAEIIAIRKAAKFLKRFDLSDCKIYSTCEPCPMCFAAIHWAKIRKLYFGCSQKDAAKIGFDDKFIYDVIRNKAKKKQVFAAQIKRNECLKIFKIWENKEDKKQY